MRVSVDASVFVAAADPITPAHADAKNFLISAAVPEHRLFCPTLLLAEVAAAIARLTRDEGQGQVAVLRVLSIPRLRLVVLTEAVARKAARLAARHFLRGADSVYVALALDAKAVLVTLDSEMQRRAAPAVRTVTPEEWLRAYAAK